VINDTDLMNEIKNYFKFIGSVLNNKTHTHTIASYNYNFLN